MADPVDFDLNRFRSRYTEVRARVAELSGDREPPTIVVVSKYLTPEECQLLRADGYGPLGENRAQELERKVNSGEDRDGWHFIGHMQRNKVDLVLTRVGRIHSVDSERLARTIDRWIEETSSEPMPCLVQVNISGEGSKGGLAPYQARELIPTWIDAFPGLRIEGLMTMAPDLEPEASRPVFRSLRDLRDEIAAELPGESSEQFRELSMGMSGDYEVATEEGATLLRLGRMLYS